MVKRERLDNPFSDIIVVYCQRHSAVDKLVEALKNALIEDDRHDGMGWRVRRLCKKALKAAGEEVN